MKMLKKCLVVIRFDLGLQSFKIYVFCLGVMLAEALTESDASTM